MKKQLTILSSVLVFLALVAFSPISESDGFYRVDIKQSSVVWSGSKITGKTHSGTVNLIDGGLSITNGEVAGGKFTIDMTSIKDTDLSGEMAEKLEGHLKSEDFFHTEKFKTANINILGSEDGMVKATITIKGISQDISFPAKVKIDGNVLSASASIEIDRSKFDVRYGSDSFFDNLGDKAIDNTLKFEVTLVASAG